MNINNLEAEIHFKKIFKKYYDSDCWGVLSGENIIFSQAGSRSAGALIELYLRWKEGKIIQAKARVYGGPYLIISVGFLCEWIFNKEKKDLLEFNAQGIFNKFIFQLDFQIPETKKSAIFLIEDLLQSAIMNLNNFE